MQMTGALFFVSLLGYALLIMAVWPKMRMGGALLSALCAMLFAAFWGCIAAGWLTPVAYGLIYSGLALAALGAVAAAVNFRGMRRMVLCPALLFYAALCAALVAATRGMLIQDHDSLSYWARAVKELFVFDRFYIHADATMFHTDYIPLQAALQYCIVRVFGWQDAYLVYVTVACAAAGLAAVADVFEKKTWQLAAPVILLYAYSALGFTVYDLRADGPMVLVFFGALVSLLFRREDESSSFVPALSACAVLVGFKIYSGLMLAAVLLVGMLVEWLRLKGKCGLFRKAGWMTLLALVLAVSMQLGWSVIYNVASAAAQAEALAKNAAYLGQALPETAEKSLRLGQLFAGNHRTAQLLTAFTPEQIDLFKTLAAGTWQLYVQSLLPWMWLFLVPAAALAIWAGGKEKKRAFTLIALLLMMAVIYVLGLFGSYFVQSETAAAAAIYLRTASTPLLMAALFLAAWLSQGRLRMAGRILTALMVAGLLVLAPPATLLPSAEDEDEGYILYAALADEYFNDEIEGLLTPEDAGKRALLIECSYNATEVKSQSGKSHAYAWFGLPLRVTEPIYYVYGDYTQLDTFDGEWLLQQLKERRIEVLLLRVEDELYWSEISSALELWGDYDSPTGVYDVSYDPEEDWFTFEYRMGEDEEW